MRHIEFFLILFLNKRENKVSLDVAILNPVFNLLNKLKKCIVSSQEKYKRRKKKLFIAFTLTKTFESLH